MTYDDFPEVIGNLQKVRRSWARLSRIIGQEGADAWKLERLYLDIVQAILIIGLKTGLVTPHIRGVVGGVPPPGGMMDWGEATMSMRGWELGLPPTGGGHEGSGTVVDGDLYPQE